MGAPLTVGYGEGENYVGSDALALAPFTSRISYLEEDDWAVVHHDPLAAPFRDRVRREIHGNQPLVIELVALFIL